MTVLTHQRPRIDTQALAEFLPRLCRWPMLTVGVVVSWALTWWRAGDVTAESGAVWLVRFAVVVGAVGAIFALDDPSRDVTEPTTGARRRLMPLRLSAVVVTVGIAAAPAWLVVRDELSGTAARGLAIEATAMVSLMCAVTLTLQRQWRFSEPAQYAVFSVLLVAVAEQATAGRWPLLIPPGPGWSDAHWRWLGIGVVAMLLCAWQLRDPAAGRRWWKVGRQQSRDR